MKTHRQSVKAILVGAALISFASACERRDAPATPLSPTGSVPSSAAPTAQAPAKSTTPHVGEGEREAAAMDPRAVVEQFKAYVANDPEIAAASNAALILTVNGELVLQGTVENSKLKGELEDYAEKLAGREVRNDIELANR